MEYVPERCLVHNSFNELKIQSHQAFFEGGTMVKNRSKLCWSESNTRMVTWKSLLGGLQ